MHRSALQYQLAQKTGISLLAGIGLWVLLLLQGASMLRGQSENASYQITTGPLHLQTLSKQQSVDGFTIGFTFESGLLWYLAIWLLLGLCIGWLRARAQRNAP